MFAARGLKPWVRALAATAAVAAALLAPAATASAQQVCTPELKPGVPPERCVTVTGIDDQIEWAKQTAQDAIDNLPTDPINQLVWQAQETIRQKIEELGSDPTCVGGPGGPICIRENPIDALNTLLCNLDTGSATNPWHDLGNCYYRR